MCYSSKENNFKETKHSAFIKKNEVKWGWGESRNISGYSESFYSFPAKHFQKSMQSSDCWVFLKDVQAKLIIQVSGPERSVGPFQ